MSGEPDQTAGHKSPDETLSLHVMRLLDRSAATDVRTASAQALGELDNPRAIEPLLTVLEEGRQTAGGEDDAGWDLRLFAVSALGKLGRRLSRAVIQTYGEGDYGIKGESEAGHWSAGAIEGLVLSLSDPDATIRMYAAEALAKFGNSARRAAFALLQGSAQPLATRFAAACALTKLFGDDSESAEMREVASLFGPKDGTPRWVGAFLLDDDHLQFWLHDGVSPDDVEFGDDGPLWVEGGYGSDLPLQVGVRLLCILTTVYEVVAAVIEVHNTAPHANLDEWDSVIEGSIEVPSGRLAVVDAITTPDMHPFTLRVQPGTYRARVHGNSDPLGMSDSPRRHNERQFWRIAIWPQSYASRKVLILNAESRLLEGLKPETAHADLDNGDDYPVGEEVW